MHPALVGDSGCIVAYRARSQTETMAVLVLQVAIVHVRRGTKSIRAAHGGAPAEIRRGRVVVMPPGMRLMSELFAEDESYESTVLTLEPNFLARVVPQVLDVENDGRLPVCLVDPVPALVELMEDLPARFDGPTDRRMLDLKLEQVALTLATVPGGRRVLAHAIRSGSGETAGRLQRVMRQHFCEPLKLEDYATLCGRSLSSFKRDFKSVYGAAPGDWLVGQRLAYASQLLVERGRNVTQACFESGFGSVSHFIRAFRDAYSLSPKQYQLKMRRP